jgi:hypothetical protein
MGWPWPWEDSQTTDYAYAFDEGRVWACCFGYAWWPIDEEEPELDDGQAKTAEFPDMTERGNVAVAGSTRSGVMVFRIR